VFHDKVTVTEPFGAAVVVELVAWTPAELVGETAERVESLGTQEMLLGELLNEFEARTNHMFRIPLITRSVRTPVPNVEHLPMIRVILNATTSLVTRIPSKNIKDFVSRQSVLAL